MELLDGRTIVAGRQRDGFTLRLLEVLVILHIVLVVGQQCLHILAVFDFFVDFLGLVQLALLAIPNVSERKVLTTLMWPLANTCAFCCFSNSRIANTSLSDGILNGLSISSPLFDSVTLRARETAMSRVGGLGGIQDAPDILLWVYRKIVNDHA